MVDSVCQLGRRRPKGVVAHGRVARPGGAAEWRGGVARPFPAALHPSPTYTRRNVTGPSGEASYQMNEHRARRILLVDDDASLLVVLAEQLRDDGFEVATARDGQEALRRLDAGWPDLILLDLMMPKIDGLALARQIKSEADLPIIVLSAIDTADSKARLLDEVAEDYVSKPYHYPELRARIQRVLARLGDRIPHQSLVLGPNLTLDLHRRAATVSGKEVQLTPTESRLLMTLAASLGDIVATETLLSRGWAETEEAEPSYVWVSMRRLRQKIEVDPDRPIHLLTVRGVGYRLVAVREDPSCVDASRAGG